MINRLSSNTTSTVIKETIKTKIDSIKSGSPAKAENNNPVQVTEKVSKDKLQSTIDGLNQYLDQHQTSLKFQYHEKLQEYYVTLVDEKTKEVVREIPPKKMLDFYAAMNEFLGLIVDKKI